MLHVPHFPLTVCVIVQSCLVEAYLIQLLRQDRRLRPVNLKRYARLSSGCRRNIVFVIDHYGLGVALYECLKQLRKDCSNAKYLVLDHEKSKGEIARLLAMGVHGYVPHDKVRQSLIHAIFCVAANQLWIPHEAFAEFLREAGGALRKESKTSDNTTPREDEILELVRERLSNREIAELLHIRVSTVKFHLSNILSKLHASSRRDLTKDPSERPFRLLVELKNAVTHGDL